MLFRQLMFSVRMSSNGTILHNSYHGMYLIDYDPRKPLFDLIRPKDEKNAIAGQKWKSPTQGPKKEPRPKFWKKNLEWAKKASEPLSDCLHNQSFFSRDTTRPFFLALFFRVCATLEKEGGSIAGHALFFLPSHTHSMHWRDKTTTSETAQSFRKKRR